MKTGPPAHLIGRNHVTRVPRTFVYLDSEAHQTMRAGARVQSFRLAVAAVDRRYHHRDAYAPRTTERFTDPAVLWKWISSWCRPKSRVVVVAHNLAYDLRVTNALRHLTEAGFTLEAIRLDGGHAWAVFKSKGGSLTLCDSLSWVPYGLDRLAPMVGIPKLGLPAWDDTDEAWFARCERDVEILAAVWRRLMAWVTDADLGNWRPTGAGQSWSAYRHRFMAERPLVHDDDEARAAERRSAYTGRCEAWQHGKIAGGPFDEWDYETAYAVVGRDCNVPFRYLRTHYDVDVGTFRSLSRSHAVLADVIVTTEHPTVPTKHGGRIVWPTGRFRSTLWDTEIAAALDHGASVTFERAWTYDRAPALRPFCTWVLEQLRAGDGELDPIIRLALKHWSRSLVGRFGARWARWARWGRSPLEDVRISHVLDGDTGERWRMFQVGRELWREGLPADAPDCAPAIMAWIMAECRVRLLRAAETAGDGGAVYLDTDAVWTTHAGSQRLRAAGIEGLRVKASARSLHVLGPRQLVIDGRVHAAGVPRGATAAGNGVVVGEAWRQLDTSLKYGEADTVTITVRRQRLTGRDERRHHLAGGTTAARRLDLEL